MQARAADDLRRLVTDALVEQGFFYEGATAFVTPRRLALAVAGLPAKGRDVTEERKGPRVGAPAAAIEGFLKAAGLAALDQATVVSDPKKGDYYVSSTTRPGRPTIEVLAEVLPGVIRGFPWPKSMRWGPASVSTASLRWVRPLQSIVATFGSDVEAPEVVPFEIDGIVAAATTTGHRFMAPAPIPVKRLEDYRFRLKQAFVELDREDRKTGILAQAREQALIAGLDLVEDEGLLDEVTGLVEWPVVLTGSFDARFLEVPDEAIRATIRANQKCFVLKDPATGRLANRFLLTANMVTIDGGKTVIAGNERVIAARLSDAKFFWDTDRKVRLEDRLEKLKTVRFHEKLGSQYERVERIAALAREIAPLVGADADLAERAARLCKADLPTEMVGEFPELQGLMGRHYATLEGQPADVAAAIEEHYKPVGPSDRVPTAPVSVAVALADKLDTLVGFWAIDEKPTGSRDPFALRRAALGVCAIALTNEIPIYPRDLFEKHAKRFGPEFEMVNYPNWRDKADSFQLFFEDRLKVQMRETGARHDLIDAVLTERGGEQDILTIVRRVGALGEFLETEDGRNLLAGYRRANIVDEETDKIFDAEARLQAESNLEQLPDDQLLTEQDERTLFHALNQVLTTAPEHMRRRDFVAAMQAMAALRPAVDAFFEAVRVNADDPALRLNRLRLLAQFRRVTLTVADFSKVAG